MKAIIRALARFVLRRYPDIVSGLLRESGYHIHKNPQRKVGQGVKVYDADIQAQD